MVLQWWKKALDKLSFRALANRLDKRRLQAEIDTHRLLLLTSYHAAATEAAMGGVAGSTSRGALDPQVIAKRAEEMDFEAMRAVVAANLRGQLLHLCQELHHALLQEGDSDALAAEAAAAEAPAQQQLSGPAAAAVAAAAAAAPPTRRSGLAAAVGGAASPAVAESAATAAAAAAEAETAAGLPAAAPGDAATGDAAGTAAGRRPAPHLLDMARVSELLKGRLGFTLRVAPSGVPHASAGDGLWLDGEAGVGQVVALYPGLVYPPPMHRRIPGYPRIDVDNEYLLSRLNDMAILDGKPWAKGRGGSQQQGKEEGGVSTTPWPHATKGSSKEQREELAWMGRQVEGRHPLALAHYANHPPGGKSPNVMVAPFDLTLQPGDPGWLPRYVPNVTYSDDHQQHHQQHQEQHHYQRQQQQGARTAAANSVGGGHAQQGPSMGMGSVSSGRRGQVSSPVLGLALVALRPLTDEELLLNYRLTPHLHRPDWYVPVDAEEEERRWA